MTAAVIGGWWLTTARAEPPGGGPPPNPVSWGSVADGLGGAAPAVHVEARSGALVTVTAEARLGELRHAWAVLPVVSSGDAVDVPLEVPPEAWLHRAAADYLTDLRVWVEVDGVAWLQIGSLAWPDGSTGAPVVWTAEEAERLAPQGVLRAELRQPDIADHTTRMMPDLSDVAPPFVRPQPGEVEP